MTAATDDAGLCCLVLHTHLPYVHHPEYDDFLEEDWLFEAMTETYLPLLAALERLRRDGVAFRLAMSMTPPLLHMLHTDGLRAKFERYLDRLLRLSRLEVERGYEDGRKARAAEHYAARFAAVAAQWERCDRDIPAAFSALQADGSLEILACAATHGFLPLIQEPAAVRAQIDLGVRHHEQVFGVRPRGFWLPECAYRPGLDALLADAGLDYVVLDGHGVTSAHPTPSSGTYRPVELPSGLAAFGRDGECSQQVWSSEVGYPGDPDYRELYRDLGYDADYRTIRPFLKPDGVRRNVGIKYHRITGDVPLHEKEPWDPDAAFARADVHAGNFLFNRSEQVKRQIGRLASPPVITAPFDTELFGHWWYEGPAFLEALFRRAAAVGADLPFRFATPTDALDTGGSRPRVHAHHSTWGQGGFSHVWLNEKNQWLWPYLHEMEERMARQAGRHEDPTPFQRRLLDQMAREVLLAESSDWLFIMTMETASHYAERRFRDHVHRFFALDDALEAGEAEEADLARVERTDAIFPDLDFRLYARDR